MQVCAAFDFKCIVIARHIMCQTSLHELDGCWFGIILYEFQSVAQDFSSKDIMTQQVSNATVTVQSLENDSTDAWLKPSCLSFILPSSSDSTRL